MNSLAFLCTDSKEGETGRVSKLPAAHSCSSWVFFSPHHDSQKHLLCKKPSLWLLPTPVTLLLHHPFSTSCSSSWPASDQHHCCTRCLLHPRSFGLALPLLLINLSPLGTSSSPQASAKPLQFALESHSQPPAQSWASLILQEMWVLFFTLPVASLKGLGKRSVIKEAWGAGTLLWHLCHGKSWEDRPL